MTKAIDLTSFSYHVNQLLQSLANFKDLLIKEEKLLKSNQTEPLNLLLDKKARHSLELDEAFKLFNQSLNQENTPLDKLIKSKIYSTFSTELQYKIKEIISKTNQCYDLNLSNGMTVKILSNLNQASLNLFKGEIDHVPSSYGSTGEKNATKTKTSLGQA